jgi:hypothetical protein
MLNFGAKLECVVNATLWSLYPWEGDSALIVQEAGWTLGTGWMGAENLTPTMVQTLNHLAHYDNLTRLS